MRGTKLPPAQGRMGQNNKNKPKNDPQEDGWAFIPGAFPLGSLEGLYNHTPTLESGAGYSLAQVGTGLPSLHEMFVSLLAPCTWERAPPRGDRHQPEGRTEQGWLQIPGTGKPRERGGSWGWRALSSHVCVEAGGTIGCFRRSLLLAHHLEAGMGLLQVESPSGVLTTCNHGAAGSSSRSWQRDKHQSVCIQHGWD